MSKKKVTKKALDPTELRDMDLDPVEDKEIIDALSKDQEVDLLADAEPVATNKSKEPEAKKAKLVEKAVEIKELEQVAKTENQLQDMIALAKMNHVKDLEISEKMMLHFHRNKDELPDYFWYQGVMLILEGKTEAVKKDLSRSLL